MRAFEMANCSAGSQKGRSLRQMETTRKEMEESALASVLHVQTNLLSRVAKRQHRKYHKIKKHLSAGSTNGAVSEKRQETGRAPASVLQN